MKHLLTAILLLAFAHTAAGERNVSLERDFGTLYGTLLTPMQVRKPWLSSSPVRAPSRVTGASTIIFTWRRRSKRQASPRCATTNAASVRAGSRNRKKWPTPYWGFHRRRRGMGRLPRRRRFPPRRTDRPQRRALIAFCAAQQTPKVAAVVSLAGAGYPLDEILQLQLAPQLLPDNMDLLLQANAITAASNGANGSNPARRSSKRCSTLRYRHSGSPACATTRARRSARCGFRYSSWAGTTTCRCRPTMPRRWQRHSPGPGRQSSQG